MKKMSFWENVTYYLAVVSTLGAVYILKCLIKKAILDSFESREGVRK